MPIEERLIKFDQIYHTLFTENLFYGEEIRIGRQTPKVCRFCGKDISEVKFSTIAHAVSEFLGNKRAFLDNECDLCNEFFSHNYENDLDKYTKPYRTLSGTKGKKRKAPSYKTKDKSARIDVDIRKKELKISGQEEKILEEIDDERIQLRFTREKYKPLGVYKALVKMAFSLLPDSEIPMLKKNIEWLRHGKHLNSFLGPHSVIERVVYGPSFSSNIVASVFRRRSLENNSIPYVIFLLCMSNFSFQTNIFLENDDLKNSTIDLFPLPEEAEEDQVLTIIHDWSSDEFVDDEEIKTSYRSSK